MQFQIKAQIQIQLQILLQISSRINLSGVSALLPQASQAYFIGSKLISCPGSSWFISVCGLMFEPYIVRNIFLCHALISWFTSIAF